MFTGLVAARGTVRSVRGEGDAAQIEVEAPAIAGELSDGDSVAVSGVCLTATAVSNGSFSADVVGETLSRTSLGSLEAGSGVNLELPLRPADRLGGHVVQGHVDGVGTVASVSEEGGGRALEVSADPALLRYVVEKGSVALDGVSLTVASLNEGSFTVALIPETLERTTLGDAREGLPVNIEVDILAKYVERLTNR